MRVKCVRNKILGYLFLLYMHQNVNTIPIKIQNFSLEKCKNLSVSFLNNCLKSFILVEIRITTFHVHKLKQNMILLNGMYWIQQEGDKKIWHKMKRVNDDGGKNEKQINNKTIVKSVSIHNTTSLICIERWLILAEWTKKNLLFFYYSCLLHLFLFHTLTQSDVDAMKFFTLTFLFHNNKLWVFSFIHSLF